jgi:hypothetical protein
MRQFDHVGLPTTQVQSEERYVIRTKVFVTDPKKHPYCVEYLRFEDGSPVEARMKSAMHIAFKVDSITEESKGMKVLIEPFYSVAGHRVGFFESDDGLVIELMEYDDANE